MVFSVSPISHLLKASQNPTSRLFSINKVPRSTGNNLGVLLKTDVAGKLEVSSEFATSCVQGEPKVTSNASGQGAQRHWMVVGGLLRIGSQCTSDLPLCRSCEKRANARAFRYEQISSHETTAQEMLVPYRRPPEFRKLKGTCYCA